MRAILEGIVLGGGGSGGLGMGEEVLFDFVDTAAGADLRGSVSMCGIDERGTTYYSY